MISLPSKDCRLEPQLHIQINNQIRRGLNVIDIPTWNKATICKLFLPVKQMDKQWMLWAYTFYIKSTNLETMRTPKQAC
ncbi:hypothetical protein H5410_022838 [Solanum commersonii]|uniref:Uncharacterized protein n=1 Tax=Solanum commersonii TaxID=4109 RepID=A0A9J5ZGJ9_SOLCO|nr:hypothetical protein H5410_022838 [Solanum commersonii]